MRPWRNWRGGLHSQIDHAGLPRLSGRRQEIQVAAPPFEGARPDAGRISRDVEPAGRLSDGRAQLRGGAIGNGEADRAWPNAQDRRAAAEALYRGADQARASSEGQ